MKTTPAITTCTIPSWPLLKTLLNYSLASASEPRWSGAKQEELGLLCQLPPSRQPSPRPKRRSKVSLKKSKRLHQVLSKARRLSHHLMTTCSFHSVKHHLLFIVAPSEVPPHTKSPSIAPSHISDADLPALKNPLDSDSDSGHSLVHAVQAIEEETDEAELGR